ncbi:AraC family transcriptional regulator [Aliifodinibius sp. S!AR15-10]|uniref:helix-turn-helix domain-containing protein n=1 Tax=Aliifodinibius sp. S!AR15-10 TaxID=2950437 RepID=UPI002866C791|nr:helix-turn-helix domain-containing protein [Aliifodinibius sp. S!AR15-10]MDR8394298.1 AraC family transcriptional regulator [Aliifodinibius sp. S!AR15-10]
MPSFNSLNELRNYLLSQPFDEDLKRYKSSLYPDDKLLFEKNIGPYFNYILDWETGKYEYLSDGFRKITGYDKEFLAKGIEATFQVVHPNDRDALHKMIAKILDLMEGRSEKEINKYAVSYNFRFKKRNGVYINLLQQLIYTALDRKGNIVYDYSISIDISRFRRDGNLSLVISDPQGRQLLQYYPKEEFAPQIALARGKMTKLDQLALYSDDKFIRETQIVLSNEACDQNLNVGNMSEMLGMSRSKFYRELKKRINITPNRLIRLYRLEDSLEYLAQNRMQIAEIAFRVGFSSPAYFSHCFQNEFDCSPTEYQEQVQ